MIFCRITENSFLQFEINASIEIFQHLLQANFFHVKAWVNVKAVLRSLKAGVNPKAVFWLGIMFLMQISCLRFKKSRISMLISHIYVLGCFVNFLVIFWSIWREIVFLKGLVKSMEIGNFEDLLLF